MRSPGRFFFTKKAKLIKLYKKHVFGMSLHRLLSHLVRQLVFSPIGLFLQFLNSFLYLHSQKTFTMRKKEGLADYRYFPEPDLPEVILSTEYIDEIRCSMPELPEAKRRRYENMGLSMQDVIFLANDDNVIIFSFVFIFPCHACVCLTKYIWKVIFTKGRGPNLEVANYLRLIYFYEIT